MGATGSYTAKATINPLLYPFTKWISRDITLFIQRGQQQLPETFALRKHEFEYLIGNDELSFSSLRALFQQIFDTDRNGLVDKFEVMCIILMTSKVSSLEKVQFFFDMFNFNSKGYLNQSELTLLLMAVTRGAYKIDQKFIPPSAKTIKALTAEGLGYARRAPNELRRPELVEFVQNNVDISAFLECWRGHASQVLLPLGMKWRDLSFPAHHISICPSKEWMGIGLPPEGFIHWRRREHIGKEVHSLAYLFTHKESFLKTVDRRTVYFSDGVLGDGHLHQGYLADRWLLTSLGMLSARPPCLMALFASTGQEEVGRYCIRFYEQGSWRSVYVDDRLPCGPDYYPLFLTSSSLLEAWPPLLEKGLAKYMGSYGHIGAVAQRPDALLTGLRYLTGGHVYMRAVRGYVWETVYMGTDPLKDALRVVLKALKEGSIVALGRSPACGMMASSKPIPPLGHLFPIVGTTVVKGFTELILRDPYSLLDATVPREGYCKTYTLRVEDIPQYYDTMVFVSYPDSLRDASAWSTEILSQVTHGPDRPAVFALTVRGKEGAQSGGRKARRKSTVAEIDLMIQASDGVAAAMGGSHMRLKERTDFSRVNEDKRAFIGEKRKDAKGAAGDKEVEDNRVQVCITISSNCEWSTAGSPSLGGVLRAKLVPCLLTLQATREAIISRLYAHKVDEIEAHNLRVEENKLLEVKEVGAEDEHKDEDQEDASAPAAPPPAPAIAPAPASTYRRIADISFEELEKESLIHLQELLAVEMVWAKEGIWESRPLALVPGEYTLYADVSYAVPYEQVKMACVPRDISEAPWLEDALVAKYTARRHVFHGQAVDQGRVKSDKHDQSMSSEISLTSLQYLEQKIFPHNKIIEAPPMPPLEHSIWVEVSSYGGIAIVPGTAAGEVWLYEEKDEEIMKNTAASAAAAGLQGDGLSQILEADSKASVSLEGDTESQVQHVPQPVLVVSPLLEQAIPPSTWPFLAETQAEAASSYLLDQMTAARQNAELLATDFIDLASKVNGLKKKAIIQRNTVRRPTGRGMQ